MKKLLFSLRHSLFTQISLILIIVTVLAFSGLFVFLQVTEHSTGKGSAINVSGSLRMQSYVLALTVARSVSLPEPERKVHIEEALNEFQRRLLSPGLTQAIPLEDSDPLRQTYNSIYRSFFHTIKPLAEAVITDPQKEKTFLNAVPAFVSHIDAFVYDLEKDLEIKTSWLRNGLIILMAGAVLLFLFIRLYLRRILFDPIENLAHLAGSVRAGDFSQKSLYKKHNEIGALSESMNYMIRDLSRLYSSLEEQVREKTADLNQQKEVIQLLYDLKDRLYSEELGREQLDEALLLIMKRLNASGAAIGLRTNSQEPVRYTTGVHAENAPEIASLSPSLNASEIRKYTIRSVAFEDAQFSLACVPAEINSTFLTLFLLFKDNAKIPVDREFINNIAQEFVQAIDNSQKSVESRRLALFEERSTIARELHDSIAQSLAFSRIQITRLSSALRKEGASQEADDILNELKLGIQTAYQQLRSVLTTFRLKPKSSDLRQNILTALDEFSERSGIRYTIDNEMQSFELNANNQIHLLQILRESLTNVEKHARASSVKVTIHPDADGFFVMRIQDNGQGFTQLHKEGHYGLEIMNERAKVLGGSISIEPNTPKGTQVVVRFKPA